MPIGYLDVPTGADLSRKRELVKALYEALHEAYPFPEKDQRGGRRCLPASGVHNFHTRASA
jgi:hypothetical protein